jgi:hypothetical protein
MRVTRRCVRHRPPGQSDSIRQNTAIVPAACRSCDLSTTGLSCTEWSRSHHRTIHMDDCRSLSTICRDVEELDTDIATANGRRRRPEVRGQIRARVVDELAEASAGERPSPGRGLATVSRQLGSHHRLGGTEPGRGRKGHLPTGDAAVRRRHRSKLVGVLPIDGHHRAETRRIRSLRVRRVPRRGRRAEPRRMWGNGAGRAAARPSTGRGTSGEAEDARTQRRHDDLSPCNSHVLVPSASSTDSPMPRPHVYGQGITTHRR